MDYTYFSERAQRIITVLLESLTQLFDWMFTTTTINLPGYGETVIAPFDFFFAFFAAFLLIRVILSINS